MAIELKARFKLSLLLNVLGIARSVYYYHLAHIKAGDKYSDVKVCIKAIYHEHKGRYGYRRIMYALRQQGHYLNHKTVQRLMKQLGLKSTVRPKRYSSYRQNAGESKLELMNRDFEATKPNQKWVTDVTEFNVSGQKVYLSPVIDLFNREVIAYRTAKNATLPLVSNMLEDALGRINNGDTPMFHSDQGWQYRHRGIQKTLRDNNITQSMSRKGNCLDNAVAESFFGVLKTEMYHRKKFKNADELIEAIDEYIHYYNHKRIKLKLKGLSPVDYRNQALKAA